MRQVPVAELDDYRRFLKDLQNDVSRYVQTTSTKVRTDALAAVGDVPAFVSQLRNLPDSTLPEANRLEADARTTMQPSALKSAAEADPKFTRAWVELAIAYMDRQDNDAALDALRKAIDSDAKSLPVREMYAFILTTLRGNEAAVQAWRDAVQVAPDDAGANSALASLLMQDKRYSDAISYLETAAKTDTSNAAQVRLGTAYLHAGQTERGSTLLKKLLEQDASPIAFNDVAYELAEANTSLPKALEYAERAVDQQERQSHDIKLAALLREDLECTTKIASFWDTLGWVEFRLGHFDRAESYLSASWLLSQMAVVADHLGQVYEQGKKTDKAIHMYRLAMATPDGRAAAGDEPKKHLEHLGEKQLLPSAFLGADRSGDELSQLRTVKLRKFAPKIPGGSATAEFFLLFDSRDKPEEAWFVSGSESLRSATDALTDATFQVTFPEGSSARIVRRVILMCSKISGCQAVLYTPSSLTVN